MRFFTSGLCVAIGLTGFGLLTGCGGQKDDYKEFAPSQAKEISEGDHDHEHAGPHGGEIIELGEEEYHAEVVFDEDTEKVSVYILDASMKKAVPIAQKELKVKLTGEEDEEFTLAAAPQEGDPEGESSRFETTDDMLFEEFHEHEGLKGNFELTIAGKTFKGTMTHDHEHAHANGKSEKHDKDHAHKEGEKTEKSETKESKEGKAEPKGDKTESKDDAAKS